MKTNWFKTGLLATASTCMLLPMMAYGYADYTGPTDIIGVTDGGTYTYVDGYNGGASGLLISDGDGSDSYMRLAQSTPLPVSFTFEFVAPYDIDSLVVWNDRIAVGDGIKDFELELFNSHDISLGTISGTLENDTTEQHVFFGNQDNPTVVSNVTYATLSINSFYGSPGPDSAAHQVREIGFNGRGTEALVQSGAFTPGQTSERDFDIIYLSGYGPEQTAQGTSNGIGWSICSTYFSSCCGTNTTGTYDGFNTSAFDPPVGGEDILHTTPKDFSIVFDQPINSIVFYLLENGGNASLDFGLVPEVVSGGENLVITGTRIRPNTTGGAVRFSNVNANILTHTADIFDGMNLAFYVDSLAPHGDASGVCPGQDSDDDGVSDEDDICPGYDDTLDADTDGVPDGCDACPGSDDTLDANDDGVP
ncbi:MAG: hypothetical protein D3910_05405, partial [Candidatus Electrothrix sp. ATG2]|nr:hypothetical protein [Candidatus Electrothrix sp. ATG2]